MSDFNLNDVKMIVVKTAEVGVVNRETVFQFSQQGNVVTAKYLGGGVIAGFLVGRLSGAQLTFRYCQADASGNLDGGSSTCLLERLNDGRIRLIERFSWASRDTSGENIFEELGK